jgi:hypothetical protein
MYAHVLQLKKATFERPARIAATNAQPLRSAPRRRRRWPDASSAAFEWTAYRLAPRA